MAPALRSLGRNGPLVDAIGFGAMSLGHAYGFAGTDEERLTVLDRVYEIGNTFWDTADLYADCEDVFGKWFARTGKRNDIFLATKFGLRFENGALLSDSSPENAKVCCERSLKRLGVDMIDLYYCHRLDTKTPIEKTIKAMVELKNQGKIKYLGLSECSSESLRRAHAVHPISVVQIEYGPFALDIENPKYGLLDTCRELGVAVVAYSPLGRGLLTGAKKTYDDIAADPFLSTLPKYSKENFPKILELVTKLEEVAAQKGCTTAQVTLAWIMAQGDDIIPLPGTKTPKYLEQNFAAQDVILSQKEVDEIREVAKRTEVEGARYPDSWGAQTFVDTPPL